jgi:sporulation protein YqfC
MKKGCKPRKEKRGLAELLAFEQDIPAELLCGGCFLELHGRNQLSVRGCRRIVLYTPTKIILKMKKDMLAVCGKRLSCVTYLAGAVTVEGLIDSVSFLHGDMEGV